MLTIKFYILKKLECPVWQIITYGFYSAKMVNISKWMPTVYILEVGPCMHVFQVMHMCFRAIWLDFTQETKKCLKRQEYELKLKIWSLHDESLVETIKIYIWHTWFGARMRMLCHFENALDCKIRGSDLENWRVRFSRIRLESESRFSPYLVRILRFMKMAMSGRLYICRSRPIVTSLRSNQSFFYLGLGLM
jgi:hypothetical protein